MNELIAESMAVDRTTSFYFVSPRFEKWKLRPNFTQNFYIYWTFQHIHKNDFDH